MGEKTSAPRDLRGARTTGSSERLRAPVQATGVIGIWCLIARDGEYDVRSVHAALEEGVGRHGPHREHHRLRPAILTHEPAHVVRPPSATKLPERLLAEEQVDH